jgi:hypothetical protein
MAKFTVEIMTKTQHDGMEGYNKYVFEIACFLQYVKNYFEVLFIEEAVGAILFSSEIKQLLLVNDRRKEFKLRNCK